MIRSAAFSPGAQDGPARSLFSQSPQEDESMAQASCIFSDVVNMRIKPAGRDEYASAITVRLRPDNAAHPRSLLLELTSESDLLFYHSLLLGEGDFHTLKSEQRLLVDFQSFPLQLVELLRRCMETGDSAAAPTISPSGTATLSSSFQMLASLECSSNGQSTFNITESNQFRELTHICLRLQQGTDETIKNHLAGKLKLYRTESSDLAERLRVSEESVFRLQRRAEELSAHAQSIAEERRHVEQTLTASHQQEVAQLKQEHANAIVLMQQTATQERSRVETELQLALSKMTSRAAAAERLNDELQQKQITLTTSGDSYRERLGTSDAQLQEARREITVVREQLKELEVLKYRHEREIGERDVQVSSLREQLANKEQLVTTQSSQIEQASSQRKSVEDSVVMYKQQVSSLEEKFNLSAQEITKGNQIIQKLRADIKQLKAKLKLKADDLSKKEQSVHDLERAEVSGRHMVEEKEQELLRAKEREERQRQDVEDLKKKLAEAHEVLKSNHDVIDYLNRQLTERDLNSKSIPMVAASLAGAKQDTQSTALSELLKQTEALGLKPMGLKAASSFVPGGTGFSMTGLSELGLGSGSRAFGTGYSLGAGPTSNLMPSGLAAPSTPQKLTTTNFSALATPPKLGSGASAFAVSAALAPDAASSPDAMGAAARAALSGPVAYRSPSATSPVAVK